MDFIKTLPLSRDLREGEREKPRSTHVTRFLCCLPGWASSGVWDTEPEQGSFA